MKKDTMDGDTMDGDTTSQAHEAADQETETAGPYVVVIKVGGNELDDESFLFGLVKAVQAVLAEGHFPVIVHGGGKAVTELGAKLGIAEQRIEGLRVTDEASLDVAEMVLSAMILEENQMTEIYQ
jgi:acetylglutamate kinase